MSLDFAIGHYYQANSPIHRLDPRAKLTFLLLFIVTVFLVKSPWVLGAFAVLMMAAALASRVPFGTTLRALLPLSWILIFPLLINLICVKEGVPLVGSGGWFTITDQGLYTALFMTLRLFLLLLAATVLTLTTSPIVLCDGIENMFMPLTRFGFPAHEIGMMTSIALRFVPLLLQEAQTIRFAQMSRGAEFDTGGLVTRAKNYATILAPLFSNAIAHAEDLALAMESRCYTGGKGRTHYHELRLCAGDVTILFLGLALLVLGIVF